MSQDTPSERTEQQPGFAPSISAVREHRARQQADHIINEFATRFTEKDFFPDEGDGLLFAMLTQLHQWPADTQITILDGEGEVAGYLKGRDERVVQHAVVLMLEEDGSYSDRYDQRITGPESLFQIIFSQLPVSSELGSGGDFHGSESIPGRIVTLREQIAGLARSEWAMLFEALMADSRATKSDLQNALPNPFLPLWKLSDSDRRPVLVKLLEMMPQLPSDRAADLLNVLPMTESQRDVFLLDGTLPVELAAAVTTSLDEWATTRAIDGLLHTRTFDAHTDAKARRLAERLLKAKLGRQLIIVERDEPRYDPTDQDESNIVLASRGYGEYRREDRFDEAFNEPLAGVDSFYLKIISFLHSEERAVLGLQSEEDAAGFRAMLASAAIEENGGWFDSNTSVGSRERLEPDWFKQASVADKLAWRGAVQDYTQAILQAQVPDSPSLDTADVTQGLYLYAREKLRVRLKADFDLEFDPDEIIVSIPVIRLGGGGSSAGFPHIGFDAGPSTARRVSLTQVSVENVSFGDVVFLTGASVADSSGRPIPGFGTFQVYRMVREVDIGDAYSRYLRTLLLGSTESQWYKERYAQVMHAQMQVDSWEAKMAGDYLEDGKSPAGQEDRGYKWVKAVLDHPDEDGKRPLVEQHQVKVGRLRIASRTKPDDMLILDDYLIFGLAAPQSVSAAVLYTANTRNGKCFVELNSLEDFRPRLGDSEFQNYLVNEAPSGKKDRVRWMLENKWRELQIDVVPCTGNFLEATYEAKAERVIALADEKTTSTWEKNWTSAWDLFSSIGDIALSLTPFKVAMPIAAVRSLYSLSQAVRGDETGNHPSVLYAVAAASFLAEALPGPKRPKIKLPGGKHVHVINFKTKLALAETPDGLKLRTEGVYRGVYEKSQPDAASLFYVQQGAKTFAVRYDPDNWTWRLIDPRRPDAYYQMPIRFKDGLWVHNNMGILGGMPKAANRRVPAPDDAPAPVPGTSDGPKRYTVELSGIEHSKVFKKADQHIQEKLLSAIEKVTAEYAERGGGKFHGYTPKGEKTKIFTLDLTGMPNSKGRGAWRLRLQESETEGVLVFHSVVDKH